MNATTIADVLAWGWLSQGTVCLSLGLMGSLLLRRHAARAHQVLRLGMLAAILLPLLSLLVHHQGLGLLPATVEPELVSVLRSDVPGLPTPAPASPLAVDPAFTMNSASVVTEPVPVATSVAPDARAPVRVPLSPRRFSWMSLAVVVWLVVGLVLLFRLARTAVMALRLLRGAEPCERPVLLQALQRARTRLSIQASVTLMESKIIGSPVIWCWRSGPVILVQRDIECCPHTDWVSVFCHELAHWKRSDHRTGLWAELWFCVFWWHPLVGWAKKRLEILSEQACDDWVLACGQSGPDYAESLLGLVPETQRVFLPTVVGKDKTMKDRIIRIVKQQSGDPRVGGFWALALVLLTSLLIVGSAFAQRRAREVEREDPEGWRGGAVVDRRGEASEHHEGLARAMKDIEGEIRGAVERLRDLEEEGKGDSAEAHKLRLVIKMNEEMYRQARARQRQQPGPSAFRDEDVEHREKIIQRMEETRRELEEAVRDLHRLEKVGRRDEAHERRQGISRLERFLHELEQELHAIERHREERMHAEQREARGRELDIHQRKLQQRRRALKAELENIGDQHPERAALQAALERTDQELRRVEQARRELQGHGPRPQPQPRPDDLRRRHGELGEKAEGVHLALEAMGDRNPELQERLERELHELRAQMEEIEHLAQREEEPDSGRRDLEVKVRQLNDRVEDLGNEMREIRGLLERLVEQRRGRMFEVEEEEVEQPARRRSRREYGDRDEDPDEHDDDGEEGEHEDEDDDEDEEGHGHDDDDHEHEDEDHR